MIKDTQLDKMGLSVDMIMEGEPIEFSEITPKEAKKESENLYSKEEVDGVVAATLSDLRDAYEENQRLEAENAKLKEDAQNLQGRLGQSQAAIQSAEQGAQVTKAATDKLTEQEGLLNSMQEFIRSAKDKFMVLENEKQNLQAQVEQAMSQVEQLQTELANQPAVDPSQLAAAQAVSASLQEKLRAKEEEVASIRTDLTEMLQHFKEQFPSVDVQLNV